jgi:hypothetical protein
MFLFGGRVDLGRLSHVSLSARSRLRLFVSEVCSSFYDGPLVADDAVARRRPVGAAGPPRAD